MLQLSRHVALDDYKRQTSTSPSGSSPILQWWQVARYLRTFYFLRNFYLKSHIVKDLHKYSLAIHKCTAITYTALLSVIVMDCLLTIKLFWTESVKIFFFERDTSTDLLSR